MSKIGRNSPCPCGSGKKYKQCCLKGPSEQQKQLDDGPGAIEAALGWLEQTHSEDVRFAMDSGFFRFLDDEEEPDFPEEIWQLVMVNAYELALFEGASSIQRGSVRLLDRVLGFDGPELSPGRRSFLSRARDAHLNVYEVKGSKPGNLVHLKELYPAPGQDELTEKWIYSPFISSGPLVEPGNIVGLRFVPGEPAQATSALYFFPSAAIPGLLSSLKEVGEIFADEPDRRLYSMSGPIIGHWLAALDSRPPNLMDSATGEPFLFTIDYYDVEDVSALERILENEPDVEKDEEGWSWMEERGPGVRSPVVSLNLDPESQKLVVYGRTLSYADRGQEWLAEIAPGALTHIDRQHLDPEEVLSLGEASLAAESTDGSGSDEGLGEA